MLQNPRLPRPLWMPLCLAVAACAAPPDPVPSAAPVLDPAIDRTPGFNDREPDTCKAAGLQVMLGQPASSLQGMALAGPLRVIAPGEVFDQDEYRANRVDVRTDAAGIIASISCG
jgi:hypothetical protein